MDSKCQADYPAITINDISGRILAYNATVTFKPLKNLSFVAGVTGLKFRVDADKEKLNGYLTWGYNEPLLTATYAFILKGRKTSHDL